MKARKPMVAGNWKMNGDIVSNEHLFTALRAELGRASLAQVEVVVCPPYPYLGQAAAWLGDTGIDWGAQDVSAAMLLDLGCRWAIVGHSERRQLAGETDEQVAAKVSMCIAHGVGVIACVGETLDEREAGATETVLGRQVDAIAAALTGAAQALPAESVVLAYEPVWAIGTGRTASPEIAQAAHRFIRARLAARGYRDADATRILYGGSVKPGNAASLFALPDVDGGLIGGASLVADDFMAICRAAVVA